MPVSQDAVDFFDDQRVIERVFDVIRLAGAVAGQGDFQVELDGLRHDAFPRVHADQRFGFEVVQKNNIHE